MIKQCKSGFMILEYILYFFLFMFLTTLSFNWLIKILLPLKTKSQQITHLISLQAGRDLLERDLFACPANKLDWKKIDKAELIWRTNNIDVGYLFENSRLFRLEGSYDSLSQQWTSKTKSLVADKLEKLSFKIEYGKSGGCVCMKRIICMLENDCLEVTPRNRIWYEENA